ncbi:exopolyphosphatase [Halioglobus sp. HI00S01]|uniref:acyclic terpene utilization AtuA family protein n=1 Tax=Halioglobus sp. HI00S01 TaxID=1822214 RepID=UPI0007C2F821|nr:acyclic terpene utilization AtuA family protein [Halioglobus sp. HI00S01]KZX59064.1 exopolyphosphatase [Halioglobus sp. HI00S01]
MTDVIKVANCSGFYGDKLSAAREMVEGGPIDVLTGDYLAELTMAILYSQKMSRNTGYVGTFLKQMKDVLALCLEKNIKIVTNAGGLNPAAMAAAIEDIAAEQGLQANVAYIDGDDIAPRLEALGESGETFTNMDTGINLVDTENTMLTANAYLGAWGIKEALDQGADVVVCPRVTDAAVVIGPAAWKFNWQRDNYHALAGALAAGHIIECGQQATGGNYAFFQEVPSFDNPGYPIAEIEANGHCTITKHPGTGGLVSVGTVKAQLLYEISDPAYKNPDVIGHFDSLQIEQVGEDRVYISGCKGSAPPKTHKVCINTLGGFRNGFELLLTGLDIEEKAKILSETFFNSIGGKEQFDDVTIELLRTDKKNPSINEEAFARLRIVCKSRDKDLVGRLFSAKMIELALANIPGFGPMNPIDNGDTFLAYWPALIDSSHVTEHVHVNGQVIDVKPTSQLGLPAIEAEFASAPVPAAPQGAPVSLPFGRLFGTRSGDKGGCANVGVWATSEQAYGFLHEFLTVERLKTLMPETAEFDIERYELPNIHSLNFFIKGILGEGVASSVRTDPQAKSMGEYLRAKLIDVPADLAK